tara:strand:+ start:3463 stop:3795 length:333 start_codon:yes stop_codon:yes gene_type:complete
MAGKRGGIHNYSVQESQNVTLGQAGVAYITGVNKYTPPAGQVVVAIQFLEDTVFDSTDTTAQSLWPTRAQAGPGTGSDAIGGDTMPAGTTIYGRWDTIEFDSGSAFVYLG